MSSFYLIVVFGVLISAFSQILLKKSASAEHGSRLGEYLNVRVVSAYVILGLAMVLDVFAMSRGVEVKEVSIIESLSYLFVPVLSYIFFKERISRRKILSIAVIVSGIVLFFL